MARMDELISLKEANSLLRIEMERQKGQLTDLEHSNEDLQKRTGELQQEVSQLQEANNFLKKKEQEPNSGKRLTKRANSIISDMPDISSIGAGGITPIAPFTSLNISKRLENPFEPRFEENRPKLSLSRKISLNT
jgi:predicted RNase H-like nuclease (RuvC/YqgF family)